MKISDFDEFVIMCILFLSLQNILPDAYTYKVCQYAGDGKGHFDVVLRLNMTTSEEMIDWKREFEEKTKTTLIVPRSERSRIKGQKTIFKVDSMKLYYGLGTTVY